ncbi:MAG: tetratricopeptide repeat protein [Candidatus Aminicenantaceae bacterium]
MKYKSIFILVLCLSLMLCASSQKKLKEAQEKDPQFQYNLGLLYLNRGNVDEAIKYLKKSLALNPRNHIAYNFLGIAYSMKGELEESLKHFNKCLEINPRFTDAHNNLGMIYQQMGIIDRAEEEFLKAIADKDYPTKEKPYYNLARLFYIQEKFNEALDYAQKSIKENARFAMAYNLIGLIFEKTNNFPQAIESYTRALIIVPGEINFSFNLAVAFFYNNQFSEAKEIFEGIYNKVTDPQMKERITQYLKIINKE